MLRLAARHFTSHLPSLRALPPLLPPGGVGVVGIGARALSSTGGGKAGGSAAAVKVPPTVPLSWRTTPTADGYMPRAEPITMEHIGSSYLVHSGRDYKRVKVTAQMVAHKFGEFVATRKKRPQAKKQQQGGKGQKKR